MQSQGFTPVGARHAERELRAAVEKRWACTATLLEIVRVCVTSYRYLPVQEPSVHVYRLRNAAGGALAYAWSHLCQDGHPAELRIALQVGPIRSAFDAVHAARADDIRRRHLAQRAEATAMHPTAACEPTEK